MNFNEKIKSLLFEGQNEDRALNLLKKAGKESEYDELLAITSEYKNDVNGKNNKHLLKLVQFYLDGTSIEIIKNYYDRFIKNTKIATKHIDNMNFNKFEQLVDSSVEQPKKVSSSAEIADPPYYEDDNVKIFRGLNKQDSIKYGKGSKYNFCISRIDSSNLFYGYRVKGATFYFIYFKNDEAKANAPAELIVIHAYPKDKYQINYSKPNKDKKISKDDIIKQFPVLSGVMDKIVVVPFTDNEKKLFSIKTKEITDLKTLEEKLIWIELGSEIRDSQWRKLGNDLEAIIDKYIEVGIGLIPEELISKFPKLIPRYKEKMTQLINAKIENSLYIRQEEFNFAVKNNIINSEDIEKIEYIHEYAYKYANDVLKGQNVPEIILAGIASNPYYSYNYANDVLKWQNVPEIILASIASNPRMSYMYANDVLKGQNVPERFLASIAKDAAQAYNYATNVLKGQNVPEIFLASIAKDGDKAYSYANDVLKGQNVPEMILAGIAKNKRHLSNSYNYANDVLKGQNVPEVILAGIAKDAGQAYAYANDVLKWQNVPERFLARIATDAHSSYKYANDVLKGQNVPERFLARIATDAYSSYKYANDVLKGQNVPERFLARIATDAYSSHAYARDVLKGQNVSSEILAGIAKKADYSYYYARDVLKGQNVPEIILASIAKDADYSYNYATNVLKGQNVPEIFLASIASNPYHSYNYATNVLKGQNVPEIFLASIAKNKRLTKLYKQFLSLKSLEESFRYKLQEAFGKGREEVNQKFVSYNSPNYEKLANDEHDEAIFQSKALDPASKDPIVQAIHKFANDKQSFFKALSNSRIEKIRGSIDNSELGGSESDIEDKEKVQRVKNLIANKSIDRPIVLQHGTSRYLLAGNTRATLVGPGVEAYFIEV